MLTARQFGRFARKVTVEPNGCCVWTGAVNSRGYGCVGIDKRGYLAHRVAYATVHGPIPDGLQIDHLCRTKRCVNVAHLEAVTASENIRRSLPYKQQGKLVAVGPSAWVSSTFICVCGGIVGEDDRPWVRVHKFRSRHVACGDLDEAAS